MLLGTRANTMTTCSITETAGFNDTWTNKKERRGIRQIAKIRRVKKNKTPQSKSLAGSLVAGRHRVPAGQPEPVD